MDRDRERLRRIIDTPWSLQECPDCKARWFLFRPCQHVTPSVLVRGADGEEMTL